MTKLLHRSYFIEAMSLSAVLFLLGLSLLNFFLQEGQADTFFLHEPQIRLSQWTQLKICSSGTDRHTGQIRDLSSSLALLLPLMVMTVLTCNKLEDFNGFDLARTVQFSHGVCVVVHLFQFSGESLYGCRVLEVWMSVKVADGLSCVYPGLAGIKITSENMF